MTNQASGGIPDAARLQQPLARILRPLVSLFIRCGITFPAVCDLLRELYVNVAERDFPLPGKEQTDSRVSLLTGVHRKEVARLRGAGTPVAVVPSEISRTGRILARWLSAPEFTDAAGLPRPLVRAADGRAGSAKTDGEPDDSAGAPTFDLLVTSVTRDVRPRAVLDEWLDRELVAIDPAGRIVLKEAAFIPRGGSDQQLYFFGRNLHDHIAAAVANVVTERPRFMERAVHYDGLSKALAEDLETRARDLAMTALTAANKTAAAACETDEGGAWRWNFGVYVYKEEVQPASGGSDAVAGEP